MPYSVLDLKLRITGNKYNYVHRIIQPDIICINKALFFLVNFRCLSVWIWNNSERKLIFFPPSESGSLYGPPRLNGTNNFYTASPNGQCYSRSQLIFLHTLLPPQTGGRSQTTLTSFWLF